MKATSYCEVTSLEGFSLNADGLMLVAEHTEKAEVNLQQSESRPWRKFNLLQDKYSERLQNSIGIQTSLHLST